MWRRLTSSVSANDGQRMLETPVLIRTKSLEELQADEDELGVPEGEGASSRAPGTPEPAGCQLLPPRRRVENDENVAPGEDETPRRATSSRPRLRRGTATRATRAALTDARI